MWTCVSAATIKPQHIKQILQLRLVRVLLQLLLSVDPGAETHTDVRGQATQEHRGLQRADWGECLYCEPPCHFYSSWSEATSDHWSCSESVEDKSSAVWNQGPLSSVFSSLLQMTSRHFLYFCLSSSFSPWYQRLTGRQPQAILHTTSHCFGSSSDLKFPPGQ